MDWGGGRGKMQYSFQKSNFFLQKLLEYASKIVALFKVPFIYYCTGQDLSVGICG